MPTSQERTALAFLTALALGAVGVRAVGVRRFDAEVRAATGAQRPDSSITARALTAQLAAVDSARRAPKRRKSRKTDTASSPSPRGPKLSRSDVPTPPARVDLNTASAAELERLPRVGPALARRIVEWRERHGPFRGPDDLRHVRGIGPATVRLLKPMVTFSGRHSPLDSEGSPSPAYHHRSVF